MSDMSVNSVIRATASACLLAFKETVPHLFEKWLPQQRKEPGRAAPRPCTRTGAHSAEQLSPVQRAPATQPASAFSFSPGLTGSYSFPFQAVLGRTSDSNRKNCAPECEQREKLIFTTLTRAPSPG